MPAYSQVSVLRRDGGLAIAVYTCRGADPPGPAPEELCSEHQVVFIRHGSFVRCSPQGRALADANHALFFQKGVPYRVQHPHPGGDECVTISVPDADRLAWMEALGASTAKGTESSVPWEAGLVSSSAARRLYALVADLQAGDGHDWQAHALDLLAGIRPVARAPRARPRRDRITRADVDVVEAVRMVLLRRLGEPLRLADIAASSGMTPFALCRIFARVAGLPLHRYRRRLRLREALSRLAGGERDITGLALDLGFSDHSHLTNAFRGEFGLPPSAFRALLRRPRAGLRTGARTPP
jgi:AraC family transcriptional regulator